MRRRYRLHLAHVSPMKPARWPALLPAAAAAMLAWSPASAQTPAKGATNEKPRADDFRGIGRSGRSPDRRAGDPYELSALDVQPVLLNRDEVGLALAERYPPELRNKGVGGGVTLRFVILPDGTVDSASVGVVVASSPEFVEPAAGVVRQMRFRPGLVGSTPVRSWVMLPVVFQTVAASKPES